MDVRRTYQARNLCATRSSRYRYNVTEVLSGSDVIVLKGDVFLSGERLCGMLRIEYTGVPLVEQAREFRRRLGPRVKAWVRVGPAGGEGMLTLHWDPTIGAYTAEIWETLAPPPGNTHDYRVLTLMGSDARITSVPALSPALADLKALRRVELAFHEDDRVHPTGEPIANPQSDDPRREPHGDRAFGQRSPDRAGEGARLRQ